MRAAPMGEYQMRVHGDGQVYREVPTEPKVEDDWGYYELVTPAELLAEIERLQKIEEAARLVERGGSLNKLYEALASSYESSEG